MFFSLDQNLASELCEHVDINPNMQHKSLVKHLRRAVQKYLKPLLGVTLYNELLSAHAGNTLSTAQSELLENHVKPTLAAYTKALALPHLSFEMSDAGMVRTTSESYEQVSENTFDLAIAATYQLADDQADELLEFLEQSVIDFPAWQDSKSFTIARGLLVPNAAIFTEYVPEVSHSRWVFLKLLPTLKLTEREVISSVLGKSLYDELRTKKGVDTYKELWQRCAELTAYATAKTTLEKLSPVLTQSAVLSFPSYQTLRKKYELDANREQVAAMCAHYCELCNTKKNDLLNYLEDNAATFPLFKSVRNGSTPSTTTGDYSHLTSFDSMPQGSGGFVV